MSPTKKSSKRIEATTQELLTKLEDQEIDVALIATEVPKGLQMTEEKLFIEPIWIAHPSGDDIYNIDNISKKDITKYYRTSIDLLSCIQILQYDIPDH